MTESLIRNLVDVNSGASVQIAIAPEADWMEAPSLTYMRTQDIESRYNLIYDQMDEAGMMEQIVRINEGANLAPFEDLPVELQGEIFMAFDRGNVVVQSVLEQLVNYLK